MYIHIEIHEHNTSVLIQNLRHAHAGTPSLSFKHINKHFTSHLAHYCILLFLPCNRQFVAKSLLHLWQHEVRLLSLVFGALVARQNVAQSDLMFCQDKMTFPLDILFILFFFSFLSFSLLFPPLFLHTAHSTRCFSAHVSLSHTPTLSLPVLFLFLFFKFHPFSFFLSLPRLLPFSICNSSLSSKVPVSPGVSQWRYNKGVCLPFYLGWPDAGRGQARREEIGALASK